MTAALGAHGPGRPNDKRRRHPVAKIKGGWTEAEDDRLIRCEPPHIISCSTRSTFEAARHLHCS